MDLISVLWKKAGDISKIGRILFEQPDYERNFMRVDTHISKWYDFKLIQKDITTHISHPSSAKSLIFRFHSRSTGLGGDT